MPEIYFSGQGKVFVATRNASGNPGPFRDLGNVPALRLSLETDVLEHKESRSGSRLTDLRLVRERTATVTLTLESFNVENLKMLLYGTSVPAIAGTVTNEASPTGLVVGDTVALAKPLITPASVSVTNVGAGAAWTEGTHYSVDYNAGMITVLSTAIGTAFEVDYGYRATNNVPMFKDTQVERYIRFAGMNTANANKPVTVELFRVVFDPASDFDLINDELATFELTGSVLYDSTRDAQAALGGFGRIIEEQ